MTPEEELICDINTTLKRLIPVILINWGLDTKRIAIATTRFLQKYVEKKIEKHSDV